MGLVKRLFLSVDMDHIRHEIAGYLRERLAFKFRFTLAFNSFSCLLPAFGVKPVAECRSLLLYFSSIGYIKSAHCCPLCAPFIQHVLKGYNEALCKPWVSSGVMNSDLIHIEILLKKRSTVPNTSCALCVSDMRFLAHFAN